MAPNGAITDGISANWCFDTVPQIKNGGAIFFAWRRFTKPAYLMLVPHAAKSKIERM